MNKFTRTAVGVLTVAAVIAPLSATASAPARQAAGKDWTTVERFDGARQQACKVSVDDGAAWKVYNRLDARRVTDPRVRATMMATHHREPVDSRSWDSGWVRHGDLSGVGAFKVPRQSGWALTMSVYGDDAGTGGGPTMADVGHC